VIDTTHDARQCDDLHVHERLRLRRRGARQRGDEDGDEGDDE